ncbi:hypothetical protein [Paenibacillus sp. B-A-8]
MFADRISWWFNRLLRLPDMI